MTKTRQVAQVDYRYFVVDLVSNTLLAEVPFVGVSYSRSLRESGTFSGSIPITEDTYNLSLYENTLPGTRALFVTRNGVTVWGGIIWSRTYDIVSKNLEVSASEFTSYLYNRVLWQTFSNSFSGNAEVVAGVATINLDFTEYAFIVGEPVYLDWGTDRRQYNGYYSVLTTNGTDSFTTTAEYVTGQGVTKTIPDQIVEPAIMTVEIRQDTYEYARYILGELENDFFDLSFANDAIEPGIDLFNEIELYSRSGNVASIILKQPHQLVVGQKIEVTDSGNGFNTLEAKVKEVLNDSTFSYDNQGPDLTVASALTSSSGLAFWQRLNSVVTVTTEAAHNFNLGAIVYIENLNPTVDGFHTISSVGTPGANNFQFVSAGNIIAFSPAAADAEATVSPAVTYSTYGSYANNSTLGIQFEGTPSSDKKQRNSTIRGYELKPIGDILDEYSNVPNGFEYRIDCEFDEVTNKFKKIFKFLPLIPPSLATYLSTLPEGKLPVGELAPVSAFGADINVFEYPGNVSSASLEESAEDSATRFWVQGNDPDLSGDASQPYAAAADVDLLSRGWPIIDQTETVESADEALLQIYASRYLDEARPPVSNFTISVNGSLTPEVGSYKPGDWCSVIINDDFVNLRLQSYIELRDGTNRQVLLRKIDAFEVTIPDNPSFPEEVSLELVTEPEVDKIGN
jgi:hypothetical protein